MSGYPEALDRLAAWLVHHRFHVEVADAAGVHLQERYRFRRRELRIRFLEDASGWRVELDYGHSHRWHDAQLVRLYFDLCGERMTLDETVEFYCARLETIGEVLLVDVGARWTLEALAALRPDKPLWTRYPPT